MNRKKIVKDILVIGAGVAGLDVVREIKSSPELNIRVTGFIDDDPAKKGKSFSGIRVLGGINDLKNIVSAHNIKEAIIAIPSAYGEIIEKYVKTLSQLGISFKIVPRVKEIIEGKAHLGGIRRVEVEDLLGRPIVKSDIKDIKKFVSGNIILVTGAAGSIGSELCFQIASYKPRRLILFDYWENGMFDLRQRMTSLGFTKGLEYVIGNIQDIKRLEEVFNKYKPQYVYHAAAYKHVPLMEENPTEAFKNNVIGTLNLINASIKYNVRKFVIISTDKAADPVNVMGATKKISENLGRYFNRKSKTKFIIVRFGNVLGSNGSVVPIFKKQIENGGPVTVTHKNMTRYFMTIPEACNLILKSAEIGSGGEIFVLDMGKPVKIYDLAKKMILLAGFIPEKDIKISTIGIRKGEKMHEVLFSSKESLVRTVNEKIFVSKQNNINLETFYKSLVKYIQSLESGAFICSKKDILSI